MLSQSSDCFIVHQFRSEFFFEKSDQRYLKILKLFDCYFAFVMAFGQLLKQFCQHFRILNVVNSHWYGVHNICFGGQHFLISSQFRNRDVFKWFEVLLITGILSKKSNQIIVLAFNKLHNKNILSKFMKYSFYLLGKKFIRKIIRY